jgi:hypothetical protein
MDLQKVLKWFQEGKKAGYGDEQLLDSLRKQGYNEEEIYLIEKTMNTGFSYFFIKFMRPFTLFTGIMAIILSMTGTYVMLKYLLPAEFKTVILFYTIILFILGCFSIFFFIFYYRIIVNTVRRNIWKMFTRPIFIFFYIIIFVYIFSVNILMPETIPSAVPHAAPEMISEYQATPKNPVKITPQQIEINITKQENSKKIIFSVFNTLDNNSIQPSFSWCESLNETTNASYSTEDYELIAPAVNLSVNQVTNLMVLIKVKPNALKAGNSAVCHVKVKITDYAIISPVSINIVD